MQLKSCNAPDIPTAKDYSVPSVNSSKAEKLSPESGSLPPGTHGHISHQLQHFFFFFFFFWSFLGLHLRHMEALRLGVQLELQLPAYSHSNARSLTH